MMMTLLLIELIKIIKSVIAMKIIIKIIKYNIDINDNKCISNHQHNDKR